MSISKEDPAVKNLKRRMNSFLKKVESNKVLPEGAHGEANFDLENYNLIFHFTGLRKNDKRNDRFISFTLYYSKIAAGTFEPEFSLPQGFIDFEKLGIGYSKPKQVTLRNLQENDFLLLKKAFAWAAEGMLPLEYFSKHNWKRFEH